MGLAKSPRMFNSSSSMSRTRYIHISHLVGITDTEDNGYQIQISLRPLRHCQALVRGPGSLEAGVGGPLTRFAYELISNLSPFRLESGPLVSVALNMSHQTRGSTELHPARSGAPENPLLPPAPVSNCRTVPQTLLSLGGI
jgi:hypothetical protein